MHFKQLNFMHFDPVSGHGIDIGVMFLQVIEYLVGDGPNNRYALICKQCCSHNGMALKDEFEFTGTLMSILSNLMSKSNFRMFKCLNQKIRINSEIRMLNPLKNLITHFIAELRKGMLYIVQ